MAWVSVDYALPHCGIRVLIWSVNGVSIGARRWDEEMPEHGLWYDIQNPTLGAAVTHWRPLPAPPGDKE